MGDGFGRLFIILAGSVSYDSPSVSPHILEEDEKAGEGKPTPPSLPAGGLAGHPCDDPIEAVNLFKFSKFSSKFFLKFQFVTCFISSKVCHMRSLSDDRMSFDVFDLSFF